MNDTPYTPDVSETTIDCFLLTALTGDVGRRFEMTLWGVADPGERVRVFTDDFRPMFFCRRNTPTSETALAAERKALNMRSLDMRDVDCLYFDTYAAMQQSARSLRAAGYPVYESDVNPLQRYLMERMVSGSMRVSGACERRGATARFKNPRLRGCEFIPELRVMAIDIDTGEDEGGEIREAACVEDGRARLFAVNQRGIDNHPAVNDGLYAVNDDPADDRHAEIHRCNDERQLLADLMKHIATRDPDVLTGLNVADRTLRAIQERCAARGLRFDVGREGGSRVYASARNSRRRGENAAARETWSAHIPGRAVMDLAAMLKAYGRSADDFHIDDSGALTAAAAALCVFNEAEILPNAIERSRRNGQTLDATSGSVAPFDHLYLPRLHRAGFVANDTADIPTPTAPLPGGYVIEPAPGLYENVLVFDFKSLYPSIIMTFMIDPLGFRAAAGGEKISTPIGTAFSKEISIMPGIIRELMEARAMAVKLRNPYLSQAIKLLMNSFAGVLGSTGCRFFSEDISKSITLTGQHILKTSIKHIEAAYGKRVIYGDTDSIFVDLGAGMEGEADALGTRISKETGVWLRDTLLERYGAASALELKYEAHYRHFFIPSLRGGDAGQGTKKHYCGATVGPDGKMDLTFKGMEAARSDWTDLAKEFQRELFAMFFAGKPTEDYITSVAERLQRGEFDAKLVYKKRVRKKLDAYTVNIPPHVQAAKLLNAPVRAVKYYITKNGPQPVEKLSAPIDYRHYLDCQLRPIADSILKWTGKDFDRVTSGQMELFD